MNSSVRLGVSPTDASTPTGVFNQWFEASFPHAGALGWAVCHLVHQLLPGRPAAALPTLLHNLPPRWVLQLPPFQESSPPSCQSSPLLPVWMNVSSLTPLLPDFHTVQFSVSSDFFLSWRASYVKGWSLRCSPRQSNAGCCAVTLYVTEGPRGSNGACSTLCWFSVTPSTTHNQIETFWCLFPGGWVCVRSSPLWVSPTNSPVRLGVSPAAPTPRGAFNQRFEALFPRSGALGCAVVCFSARRSSGLSVWMNDYFLFPWCWSPLLFDSLSVLVVRGGAVCPPTPPCWFSLYVIFC